MLRVCPKYPLLGPKQGEQVAELLEQGGHQWNHWTVGKAVFWDNDYNVIHVIGRYRFSGWGNWTS